MTNKPEDKQSADREALRYIAWLLAYHVPILVFILWFALSDTDRFEMVMNDPDNTGIILVICIALMAGTGAVATLAHPHLRKRILGRWKKR